MKVELTETQKSDLGVIRGRQKAMINHPEIKPILEKVKQGVKEEQGRTMSLYEEQQIAQCMWNAREERLLKSGSMNEETTDDYISFLGVNRMLCAA